MRSQGKPRHDLWREIALMLIRAGIQLTAQHILAVLARKRSAQPKLLPSGSGLDLLGAKSYY